MRNIIRAASLLCLLCAAACSDDDPNVDKPKSSETKPDAGSSDKNKDAGKDAAAASSDSRLPRPSLPRAPGKGLPAELRPPR